MDEKSLERKCKKYAKELGCLAYKFTSPAHRGVPDALFILPGGHTMYVEFKHPSGRGKLGALQIKTIGEMTLQGADVIVIDNYETFKQELMERI